MVDSAQIDTSSTLGQIGFFISVVVAAVVTLRPLIKDLRTTRSRKGYSVIANELESLKQEQGFSLQLQRHNAEWQLTAREAMRVYRMELAKAGVPEDPRITALAARLEEIEDRDIYSEHILIKEED